MRRALPLIALAQRVDVTGAIQVLAILAAVTLAAIETPIAVNGYGLPLVLAFGLVILHVGALPLAVTRPIVGALLGMGASLALQLTGTSTGIWPWWPVLIVTQAFLVFIVGLRASWPVALGAWLATILPATLAAMSMGKSENVAVSANLVVFVSISGAALTLGLILAEWRQLSDQLLRERMASAEEYSRRLLAEDRARVARELHDVVAHSMSIINIQASTARYRHPGLDPRAVDDFEEIAASSRQALGEMRSLLGVLRASDAAGELLPQPGLRDIPELVAQAERAGMDVSLRMPVDEIQVSDVAGLAMYRIVQEALTNALRHAPGAAVTVTCDGTGGSLSASIVNAAPIRPGRADGSGLGLVGMRERALSAGGTVTAGATADGGFAVTAVLPLHPAMGEDA